MRGRRGEPEFSLLPSGSSASHLPRLWMMVTQPWELVQRCRDGWASTCPLLGSKVKTLSVLSPAVIPPAKDVDLPVTHSHATALLGGQTERQIVMGSSLGLPLSLAGQARQQNPDLHRI